AKNGGTGAIGGGTATDSEGDAEAGRYTHRTAGGASSGGGGFDVGAAGQDTPRATVLRTDGPPVELDDASEGVSVGSNESSYRHQRLQLTLQRLHVQIQDNVEGTATCRRKADADITACAAWLSNADRVWRQLARISRNGSAAAATAVAGGSGGGGTDVSLQFFSEAGHYQADAVDETEADGEAALRTARSPLRNINAGGGPVQGQVAGAMLARLRDFAEKAARGMSEAIKKFSGSGVPIAAAAPTDETAPEPTSSAAIADASPFQVCLQLLNSVAGANSSDDRGKGSASESIRGGMAAATTASTGETARRAGAGGADSRAGVFSDAPTDDGGRREAPLSQPPSPPQRRQQQHQQQQQQEDGGISRCQLPTLTGIPSWDLLGPAVAAAKRCRGKEASCQTLSNREWVAEQEAAAAAATTADAGTVMDDGGGTRWGDDGCGGSSSAGSTCRGDGSVCCNKPSHAAAGCNRARCRRAPAFRAGGDGRPAAAPGVPPLSLHRSGADVRSISTLQIEQKRPLEGVAAARPPFNPVPLTVQSRGVVKGRAIAGLPPPRRTKQQPPP
ncbi:unnamed protein product, partial [Phaeothamnion confervicola]